MCCARDSKQTMFLDSKMALGRPVQWETMFRYMDGNVSGISPQEAFAASRPAKASLADTLLKRASKPKAALLDVRSPDDGASDIEW